VAIELENNRMQLTVVTVTRH